MLALFRLLVYNAFLMHIRVPTRSFGRDVMAAPAYRDRAHEIGETVAGRYDAVALMEVFDENEQAAVLEGWAARRADHVLGPGPSLLRKSSGLLTVVEGATLARTAHHRYGQRGSLLHDADVLANKGVLLAEIDVGGPANLELYSTHLVAGNDFRPRAEGVHPPNPFRLRQVEELLAFVGRVHRSANVALVVGDLNVDAAAEAGPAVEEHQAVRDAFGRAGFNDVWETHGSGAGYTFCELGTAAQICAHDPTDEPYCAEPAGGDPGVGAKRIDHAWLQRPTEDHRIVAAVNAIRRRSFPRAAGAPDRGAMPFLSDHLALDLELALVPDDHTPSRRRPTGVASDPRAVDVEHPAPPRRASGCARAASALADDQLGLSGHARGGEGHLTNPDGSRTSSRNASTSLRLTADLTAKRARARLEPLRSASIAA